MRYLKSFMRNPRTTQERRLNGKRCDVTIIDGHRIKIRAKRSFSNLPSSYDDLWTCYASRRCYPWKLLRKTQYRPVDA